MLGRSALAALRARKQILVMEAAVTRAAIRADLDRVAAGPGVGAWVGRLLRPSLSGLLAAVIGRRTPRPRRGVLAVVAQVTAWAVPLYRAWAATGTPTSDSES